MFVRKVGRRRAAAASTSRRREGTERTGGVCVQEFAEEPQGRGAERGRDIKAWARCGRRAGTEGQERRGGGGGLLQHRHTPSSVAQWATAGHSRGSSSISSSSGGGRAQACMCFINS